MIGARSSTLELRDARLHLCEVGPRSAPPLLVLHGGPGESHDVLRPHLDHLASPSRRVVYYDQRGGGRSPLAPGARPAGIDEHVADVERVRAHLGGEPLDLLGFSWGARLALRYVCDHPDAARRVVLVSPPAPAATIDRGALAAAAARSSVRAVVETIEREARGRPEGALRARFAARIAPALHDPTRVLELTPVEVDEASARAAEESLREPRPERGPAASLRALVVFGRQDALSAPAAAELAERLGAELVGLDACGHAPFVEVRDAFLESVSAFLA